MNMAIIDPLRTYWQRLGLRERRQALVVGALLLVLLLYLLLWLPLQRDLAWLRAETPKAQAQLEWMRAQAPLVRQLRQRGLARTDAAGLLPAVERSASAHGLKANIARLESEGERGLRVALDAVPFNTLVLWLAELQKNHAIAVEEAILEAHTSPGLVNARLRLRAAAP